jgi:hypothetical protein
MIVKRNKHQKTLEKTNEEYFECNRAQHHKFISKRPVVISRNFQIPKWPSLRGKVRSLGHSENNQIRADIQTSRPHHVSSITHPGPRIRQIRTSRSCPIILSQ